jgi:YbbR domain-containing protein
MKRFLREHIGWKLLSLAIAAVLWYVVVGEPRYVASVSAPLEFSNVPRDLEISSEKPDTISLEMEGPAGQLDQQDLAGVTMVLDLGSIVKPSEQAFTLGPGSARLPAGVRLIRAVPSQIRLRFERRLTREVPVRVHSTGTGSTGHEARGLIVSPPRLRIVGPESRVNEVAYAETDVIDLTSVTGAKEFRVGVFVDDPQVRFESAPQVTVKVGPAKGRLAEGR